MSCGSVPLAADEEVEEARELDRKSWYRSFQLVERLLGLCMLIVMESVAVSELGSSLLPPDPAVISGAFSCGDASLDMVHR